MVVYQVVKDTMDLTLTEFMTCIENFHGSYGLQYNKEQQDKFVKVFHRLCNSSKPEIVMRDDRKSKYVYEKEEPADAWAEEIARFAISKVRVGSRPVPQPTAEDYDDSSDSS